MAKEEAIKRINDIRRNYARYVEIVTENENEAFDMAINALEETEMKEYKLEKAIDEIKAEINTEMQTHLSPKDDVFFCLDYACRVIDEKVKEHKE